MENNNIKKLHHHIQVIDYYFTINKTSNDKIHKTTIIKHIIFMIINISFFSIKSKTVR